MEKAFHQILHQIREHTAHWLIGGAFLTLTGLAPEEWLARTIHGLNIPDNVLHLWSSGVDVRVVPITIGLAVIALALFRQRTPLPASGMTGQPGDRLRSENGIAGAVPDHPGLTDSLVADRPSIAVLPFDNLSGDKEQDYFSDGMVEEIITGLTHVRWLSVISRNSSFTYKGRAIDVRQVGRDLGVRYVLEGSIRRATGRVRIAAQLIDAATGGHVWAERFDGELQDVFALQDQVTDSIIRAIAPTLRHAELERVRRKPPDNLDAYDLYLRALPHWYTMTREGNAEAMTLLDRALTKDGAYAPALALKALALGYGSAQGWIQPPGSRNPEMRQLARDAAQNDPSDADVVAAASHILAYTGAFDEAGPLAERACVLGPNSAFAWGQAGYAMFHVGNPSKAVACFQEAVRLDPVDPTGFSTMGGLTYALIGMGRDAEAIEVARQALQKNPNYTFAWRGLAAALALTGRIEDGHEALVQMLRLEPGFTISALLARAPSAPRTFVRVIEGLRLLGVADR
jgi:adenylate cyclase